MDSKYHLRKNYEAQLIRLAFKGNVDALSDYNLLLRLNEILIKNDCVPFEAEELEIELH